jgi:heme exporter protein A
LHSHPFTLNSVSHASSTSPSAAAHLSVRGLACERGARRLFEGVDLELRASDLVWLRGENGRGKTSLLRLIAGIATPAAGEVRVAEDQRLIYIGHANALNEDLSAREALGFLLRVHGQPADEACIASALTRWNMLAQSDSPVRTLSQGQRRRVALARLATGADACLWVLDEPFDALDTDGVQRLNELLVEHLQRGGSALITGHQAAMDPALPWRGFDLDRCAARRAPHHAAH